MTDERPKHHRAIHPGEILREELRERGISTDDFARRLGMSSRNLHNFLRGNMPLSKDLAIISIQDRIDTSDELFPDTKPSQVICMFGSLSEECAVLRKASAYIIHLQQNIRSSKKTDRAQSKLEREKNIVNMYNERHSIGDIFAIIGIPFAKQHFKMAGLSLAPFGKDVELHI